LYWAINVGAALAPIAAGFLAHINYLWLFIGDALTTLIYGLIVLWRIRETQPAEAQHAARVPFAGRVRQLGSEPVLLGMTFLTLIFGVVYMQGFVTLPLDMQNHGLRPGLRTGRGSNGILVVLTIQLSRAVSSWPHFRVIAAAASPDRHGVGMNAWATSSRRTSRRGVWTWARSWSTPGSDDYRSAVPPGCGSCQGSSGSAGAGILGGLLVGAGHSASFTRRPVKPNSAVLSAMWQPVFWRCPHPLAGATNAERITAGQRGVCRWSHGRGPHGNLMKGPDRTMTDYYDLESNDHRAPATSAVCAWRGVDAPYCIAARWRTSAPAGMTNRS
jgi:hypothetical protein